MRKFEIPEIEIEKFISDDIITASGTVTPSPTPKVSGEAGGYESGGGDPDPIIGASSVYSF